MNQFARSSDTRHRKRALAIVIACGSLLVLPSCLPNLRPPEPGPGVPEKFNVRPPEPRTDLPDVFPESPNDANGPESSARVGLEEFFHDPKLTGLVRQALAGNQEQKILIQEVQIAANEILARQGAFLPFLSVGAGSGLNKVSSFTLEGAGIRDDPYRPGKFFTNPHGNHQFGLDLTWQIDIWGQLHNARDAAIGRFLATNEGRNYAVTRLVAEIADNYYELLALDQRLLILDQTIALFEQSRKIAEAKKEFARDTELGVQRFEAEVRKNQSEKQVVNQQIIEAENRINFLVGRYPQPVERMSGDFIDLSLHALSLGVPAQLLQNRPDIRQAERALEAAGLDVNVARKNFYPRLIINGGVGYAAFNPQYLILTPEALIGSIAGDLVAPLINRKAIQAEYLSANARQLQAIYNYQRVILNAFTEVINRMSKVENYARSIEFKKQQLAALQRSVDIATQLFQSARADYVDVLFAQRDLRDARTVLVETKQEQLAAVVNTYQALGGGNLIPNFTPDVPQQHHWWKHLWHHPDPNDTH
jgi:NodT family efflux transporter outer membrane factor (OMF) lipoprotein